MTSTSTLNIPGWEGIGAPRLYIKDSTTPGRVDALTLYHWDEPSVPMLVDRLCTTAARVRGPARKKLFFSMGPGIYSGTLEDALACVKPEVRSQLAARDPALLERVRGMIDVMDQRLLTEPMRLVHLQYGIFPRDDILAKKAVCGDSFVNVVENTACDPDYKKHGMGYHWAAKAELDERGVLPPEPYLITRSFKFHDRLETLPEHRTAAQGLVRVLSEALDTPERVALLSDSGNMCYESSLMPVIDRLATGKRGPLASLYLEPPTPPRIAS